MFLAFFSVAHTRLHFPPSCFAKLANRELVLFSPLLKTDCKKTPILPKFCWVFSLFRVKSNFLNYTAFSLFRFLIFPSSEYQNVWESLKNFKRINLISAKRKLC
jgi:hypothetical protein